MNAVLGYDCDGNEIYEYRILRAIWSNDINIKELDGADPRQYCAVIADDGNVYAISVYDWWYKDLIRERENLQEEEEIPLIIKPISEMVNYECAICSDNNDFYYDLNRDELKKQLNIVLNKAESNKIKKIVGKNIYILL